MCYFQPRGLDQNQLWFLCFSGKKGGRTGWIFVVFGPLSLFVGFLFFFLGCLCFAEWSVKGRVDFSVPGTGRVIPGRADLVVMAMAAESCCVVTELSCVQGQPMQAQELWMMKKRGAPTLSFWAKPQNQEQTKHFGHGEVRCLDNLLSSLVEVHMTAPWKSALSGTQCAPH